MSNYHFMLLSCRRHLIKTSGNGLSLREKGCNTVCHLQKSSLRAVKHVDLRFPKPPPLFISLVISGLRRCRVTLRKVMGSVVLPLSAVASLLKQVDRQSCECVTVQYVCVSRQVSGYFQMESE